MVVCFLNLEASTCQPFPFPLCHAGTKVISRKLSVDCLAEVESVLQRPPLVWDNLHANDYDSRRLFLGPFKGREPQLRSHLRGLLLNPNCEFEANYIPLHSLGSWFRAGKEEMKGEGKDGAGRINERLEGSRKQQ